MRGTHHGQNFWPHSSRSWSSFHHRLRNSGEAKVQGERQQRQFLGLLCSRRFAVHSLAIRRLLSSQLSDCKHQASDQREDCPDGNMERRKVSAESRLGDAIELEKLNEGELSYTQASDAERQRERNEAQRNRSQISSNWDLKHA